MTKKKENRGGPRVAGPGKVMGRPALGVQRKTYTLPQEAIEELDKMAQESGNKKSTLLGDLIMKNPGRDLTPEESYKWFVKEMDEKIKKYQEEKVDHFSSTEKLVMAFCLPDHFNDLIPEDAAWRTAPMRAYFTRLDDDQRRYIARFWHNTSELPIVDQLKMITNGITFKHQDLEFLLAAKDGDSVWCGGTFSKEGSVKILKSLLKTLEEE
jgi:hypothetical protein